MNRSQEHAALYDTLPGSSSDSAFVAGFLNKDGSASASAILQQKLHGKMLQLDNPESKKSKRKRTKPRQKFCMIADGSAKSLMNISPAKYDAFLPLHTLWRQYIDQLVSSTSPTNLPATLLKADFHGAILEVYKSKNTELVGKSGILLCETTNMFSLITSSDRIIAIQKRGTVFRCSTASASFLLFGDQLLEQSGARAAKKFKSKPVL